MTPSSPPDSPTYSTSSHDSDAPPLSEVPTVPLNQAETRLINDYMTRRQLFLSDYERYNPVQNMTQLANHVFELSEHIIKMKDTVDNVGGMIKEEIRPVVAENQRVGRLFEYVKREQEEMGAGLKDVGGDVEQVGADVDGLKEDVAGLKKDVEGLKRDVVGLKDDFGAFKTSVDKRMGAMENEIGAIRSEMNSGFAQIRDLLIANLRPQVSRLLDAFAPRKFHG